MVNDGSIIEEAYARMATSRKVSHIMLPLGSTYYEKEENSMKIDSIRTAIVNGSVDFGEMAVRYSSDRSARVNNGSMRSEEHTSELQSPR